MGAVGRRSLLLVSVAALMLLSCPCHAAASSLASRPWCLGDEWVNFHPSAPARSPPGTPTGPEARGGGPGVRIRPGRLRGDLLSILSIRGSVT